VAMTPNDVVAITADDLLPLWKTERRRLDRIDRWARWDHDSPHKPKSATPEYKELAGRAQAPWGGLIVTSVAQTLFVEGYRRPDAPGDSSGWRLWQANGLDGGQVAIHRAGLTYGLAYGLSLPGKDPLTGEPMPRMRGVSPRDMVALYEDPADDKWPRITMRIRRVKGGWKITVYDDTFEHHLTLDAFGASPVYVAEKVHNTGVCPVVRYANRLDLEGRSCGEVEPFIPLLGRIDQTVFDRLVVQRFASWIVRTIAGMDLDKLSEESGASIANLLLRLQAQDILVAPDPDSKFGSLPATPLDGFIKGEERDLTDLAAVSQTPAFELLGQMANMSAEALAAAKSSQTAKGQEVQHTFGESHEQFIRLAEHQLGNTEGASDFMAQVRWADTSIRSLAQAVDALGKMATMLGFPPELLWAKVPGITKQDVDEATKRIEQSGGMDILLKQLTGGVQPAPPAP
jgi:hypothetical protein